MDILTVQGAAELLAVDAKTVYRLIERDGLPAFKVGRQWRMRVRDLEAWIDRQMQVNEASPTYRAGQTALFPEAEGDETGPHEAGRGFSDSAFSENGDLPVHRWVPWIAGFSATFVREVLDRYAPGDAQPESQTVLDPFAGVGTTLVAASLRRHPVCGFEINPYAAEAAEVKLRAPAIPADELSRKIGEFETSVQEAVRTGASPKGSAPHGFRTRRRFLSPLVERKVLLARDFIEDLKDPLIRKCFRIALASELVGFSNYSYEPSLGTRVAAGKPEVADAPVARAMGNKLRLMVEDVKALQGDLHAKASLPAAELHQGDFFELEHVLPDNSIQLVITSPPYLNNYHYIRNSRPQMYWLRLAHSPNDLKGVEHGSFGKFWQTVRAGEALSLSFDMPEREESIGFLRSVNSHKGAYGGPGWANYAATYFSDCHRFAGSLRRVLRPGGKAIVALGNSILQGVEFRTDVLFGRICELQSLKLEEVVPLREKRTGTSIIRSSVRSNSARGKTTLYESAVVVGKAR